MFPPLSSRSALSRRLLQFLGPRDLDPPAVQERPAAGAGGEELIAEGFINDLRTRGRKTEVETAERMAEKTTTFPGLDYIGLARWFSSRLLMLQLCGF